VLELAVRAPRTIHGAHAALARHAGRFVRADAAADEGRARGAFFLGEPSRRDLGDGIGEQRTVGFVVIEQRGDALANVRVGEGCQKGRARLGGEVFSLGERFFDGGPLWV
jgi:hypothetical protein